MIKYIGLAVFAVGMTLAGSGMAGLCRKRLESLEAFVRFIDALGARISAFQTSLAEFAVSYDDASLADFCRCLCETGSFENALEASVVSLRLEPEDIRLLKAFSSGLGQLSASEELKRCVYYKNELEKAVAAVRESLPVKTKLYKSSGAMVGVLIAVLFL